jgi:MoaA/NifB/PqqE/SkfB family radical SAM enzyme
MNPNKFEGREKLAYHLEWLHAYMRGDAVTPISVEIDLTNVCNYRCPNCVWGDYIGGNRAKLTKEQALDQVRQCAEAGVRAIIFSGGGEPLAHPAALECIQEAKNLGLSVGLFTNAVYVTPQSAAILTQCANWIRVHLDAVSSDGYRNRHGRCAGDLQRVRNNLFCLNRYRPKPEIGLGSIVMSKPSRSLGIS